MLLRCSIIGLGLLSLVAGARAENYVDPVTGRTWRQLTETSGFSWNQVSTVCNFGTGICSGALGSISFSGWTWASRADINELLTDFGFPGFIGSASLIFQGTPIVHAPLFDAVFDRDGSGPDPGAFGPTYVEPPNASNDFKGRVGISGVSRELHPAPFTAYAPRAEFDAINVASGEVGTAYTIPVAFSVPATGVWLFAAPVPEPSAYVFMLAGLGLVGCAMRRRKRSFCASAKCLREDAA